MCQGVRCGCNLPKPPSKFSINTTRFTLAAVLATVAISLAGASPTPELDKRAKICARCTDTIVYAGLTRTRTLIRQSSVSTLNTVQCNYDSPAISGFSPYCVYNNLNGSLFATNTGGACPSFVPTFTTSDTKCPTKFP
ncbi:hypothetical protein PM082_009851 [Marasmius tenuissimus]|nr:hypothetical protein PM082_009851 [Marasmius tenuissimus]